MKCGTASCFVKVGPSGGQVYTFFLKLHGQGSKSACGPLWATDVADSECVRHGRWGWAQPNLGRLRQAPACIGQAGRCRQGVKYLSRKGN